MKLENLNSKETLALGGLLRLMIRSDGDFSEVEEAVIDRLSLDVGEAGCLWKVISSSAQAYPHEDAIREAAAGVTSAPARAFIREVLGKVAASDGLAEPENDLLAWLSTRWS